MVRKVAAKKTAMKQKLPYDAMIRQAIAGLGEKNGSTAQRIARYIAINFKVGAAHAANMKMAMRRAMRAGRIVQKNGRFQLKKASSAPVAKKVVLKKRAARPKRRGAAGRKMKRRSSKKRSSTKKARKAVKKTKRPQRKSVKKMRQPMQKRMAMSMPRRAPRRAARVARIAMKKCF